ncbi:MAG: hypothetical protein AAF192_01225 [Pseudomonadota bacterium]
MTGGRIILGADGRLYQGRPIAPVPVIAEVWTAAAGGRVRDGKHLGIGNSLRDALAMVEAAGFAPRGDPRFDGVTITVPSYDAADANGA